MDIHHAMRHKRLGDEAPACAPPATSSTSKHVSFEEAAARIEDDYDSADEFFDDGGIEMTEPHARKKSGTRTANFMELDDAPKPTSNTRLPGGFVASRMRAQKEIKREKDREELRLKAATPKAIEEALREQRERARRRKRVKAICPNPYRMVRAFLADPVTRFWLGCNLCCTFLMFFLSFGFMWAIYPVTLRPTLKY